MGCSVKIKEKETLTMVHGFTQNHRIFLKQKNHFKKKYNVFTPDLLGHGRKGDYTGPFGIEEYAEDILKSLDENNIHKTHFWGTHTGAAVGLVLAYKHPDRFLSLILEGAVIPGFEMPQVVSQIEKIKEIAVSKSLADALVDWYESSGWFSVIRSHPERCRAEEQKQIVFEFKGAPVLTSHKAKPVMSLVDKIGAIHHPCLIYNGSEDLDDFKSAALLLVNNLPAAKFVEFFGLGGFPAWEDPVRVNLTVDQFLDSLCF